MILVTTTVPGRWESHPHLVVVLLTVPAFGPWDDRAATSRSRIARRQFELRYPAARGNGPYAPMLETPSPQLLANEKRKTKRPTRVVCAGGASKLLDSKERQRPTTRVSPFVYLRHYGLRVNLERSPTSSYSTDSRPRPTRASSSTAGRGPAVGCSGARSKRRTWSCETKFSRVTIFEGRAF